jgi:hypothetical protein
VVLVASSSNNNDKGAVLELSKMFDESHCEQLRFWKLNLTQKPIVYLYARWTVVI